MADRSASPLPELTSVAFTHNSPWESILNPDLAMEDAMSHQQVSTFDTRDDLAKLLNDREELESDLLEDSHLSKDEERKHKNREAAARSRQRARDRMARLEQLVSHLLQRNYQLQLEADRLKLHLSSYERVPPVPAPAPSLPPTYNYPF